MPSKMRIEVFYRRNDIDGRALRLNRRAASLVSNPVTCGIVDVYLLSGIPGAEPELCREIFSDRVAQRTAETYAGDSDLLENWDFAAEITYRAGVTDPVAITAREAMELAFDSPLPGEAVVQTARQYLFSFSRPEKEVPASFLKSLFNPLIQQAVVISRKEWNEGKRFPEIYPYEIPPSSRKVRRFPLHAMDDSKLLELSRERLLALSLKEMKAVQAYFSGEEVKNERTAAGISTEPTDVELEMIAQTWSEHCKHKIFQADIEYRDGGTTEKIHSLFSTYIKSTTEQLAPEKTFLRSVFHDNSGVIAFTEDTLLCFKAETHNSPSALDPYGGAITGIVGVNRDIIGTGIGAQPLFNTNVLCFGELTTPPEDLPEGLLHPSRILEGVHQGIIDGGNQSGIPVAGGAFLFDESYTGKPLVFCGTGGIMPAEIQGRKTWEKKINPGDLAVMVGGRIGKDGIHGATFSSRVLDEESPTSAVQIGDPITQKKMLDFLLEARDLNFYSGITDNGAGGLSSSLGEMAELSGGIRIDLHACPLKYLGLAPWEILVSESQERMSCAVPPADLESFLSLAERRGVEAAVVGEFTDSGFVDVRYEEELTAYISLEFLHNGLPRMELTAEWVPPERVPRSAQLPPPDKILPELLREPNIASKEKLVRQYDHEVKGHSIGKPFTGKYSDGPSDGGVLKPLYDSWKGITVTHGICPRYGDLDTYAMAMCAVDEAFRAHIACGGDPDFACGLDNFCWPDPVESAETPDGKYKLAQLVRACRGLQDACTAYGIPLISGKDSMKNDASLKGKKVSVRPTLLISLMGIVPDVRKIVSTDFKSPGDSIYLIGETKAELGGTFLEKILGETFESVPRVRTGEAMERYRRIFSALRAGLIASCHDLSDGGLGVALAESVLGGCAGAEIDLTGIESPGRDIGFTAFLFSETPSRFIVSVSPEAEERFLSIMTGSPVFPLGKVVSEESLNIRWSKNEKCSFSLRDIQKAWKREGRELW